MMRKVVFAMLRQFEGHDAPKNQGFLVAIGQKHTIHVEQFIKTEIDGPEH